MIGRWVGSVNVFPLDDKKKIILKFIVPFVAFELSQERLHLLDMM